MQKTQKQSKKQQQQHINKKRRSVNILIYRYIIHKLYIHYYYLFVEILVSSAFHYNIHAVIRYWNVYSIELSTCSEYYYIRLLLLLHAFKINTY